MRSKNRGESIREFQFGEKTPEAIEFEAKKDKINWSTNWPVIYILRNENEIYVGETYKIRDRVKQHLDNEDRKRLNKLIVIIDKESNKSYALDLESFLIRYLASDGVFRIQNSNKGLVNYEYYMRKNYIKKFNDVIWPKLQEIRLAKKSLKEIQNKDIFKYSPYTPLVLMQQETILGVLSQLANSVQEEISVLIEGGPGTGKTVLGSYLVKLLLSNEENFEEKDTEISLQLIRNQVKKIGFVIPQQSLRKTLKKVFSKVSGLNSGMVLSPHEVVGKNFDLLVVDESHRLRRRKNLSMYRSFDENNKKLGLGIDGTELDWILKSSKMQVFFYDESQTIKPTDIDHKYFMEKIGKNLVFKYRLNSQLRVKGGEDYIEYIQNLLESKNSEFKKFEEYDFRFFENFKELREEISKREKEYSLSRIVAGYGWKWVSKRKKGIFDIDLDGEKIQWNTQSVDWVNSKNSLNEMGCVHTIQGYDLNYAGVVFGPEITYDFKEGKLKIIRENYHDFNGKRGITDEEELERYVKNIYRVLLTRGIRGTYVYAVDKNMRKYLKEFICFKP